MMIKNYINCSNEQINGLESIIKMNDMTNFKFSKLKKYVNCSIIIQYDCIYDCHVDIM